MATAAFGLVGLRAVDLPGPRPVMDGERIRIEVVHPVEPEIVAGSRMDVGQLVDGFQGLPPALPPLIDAGWTNDETAGDAEAYAQPPPSDRRRSEVRVFNSQPEPPSAARVVQRWFGFDTPRRDFQAERAARRARLDAMEQAARERQDRLRREYMRAEEGRYAAERRAIDADQRAWPDRRDEQSRDDGWRDEGWRDEARRHDGPRPYDPSDAEDRRATGWNG